MHRIDASDNVANRFDDGDPLVPRLPTVCDAAWLNDVQENICNAVELAGITLAKGNYTQLQNAIKNLADTEADARIAASNRVAKAWASFTVNAGLITNVQSQGCGTITLPGSNKVKIPFSIPFADTKFAAEFTGHGTIGSGFGTADPMLAEYVTYNQGYLELKLWNVKAAGYYDTTANSSVRVHMVFYGAQ